MHWRIPYNPGPNHKSRVSVQRKGIILAGGAGTRLHPITMSLSKQLLPVYDKPMIYYPLAALMSAGIREFLIITTPRDQAAFRDLLGTGEQWGMSFEYVVQAVPNGIAQALILGEDVPGRRALGADPRRQYFLRRQSHRAACMSAAQRESGATVFGYYVQDPERYGVVQFDADGTVTDLLEKPQIAAVELCRHRHLFLRRARPGVRQGAARRRRAANWRSPI